MRPAPTTKQLKKLHGARVTVKLSDGSTDKGVFSYGKQECRVDNDTFYHTTVFLASQVLEIY